MCVRACVTVRERGGERGGGEGMEGERERNMGLHVSCVVGECQACLSAVLLKSWMCSTPCVLEIKVHVISMLPSWSSASITLTSPSVNRLSKVANVQIEERTNILTSGSQPGLGFRPVQHTQRPLDPLA